MDLDQHHPGLHDPRLRTAWAKGRPLVVGHAGEVSRTKVVERRASRGFRRRRHPGAHAVSRLADPDLRERLAGQARDSVADRGRDVAIADLVTHLPALV